MIETLNNITSYASIAFFLRQIFTILGIYAVGFVCVLFCEFTNKRSENIDKYLLYLLAFPVGISLYVVSGLFLLILNIPFNIYTVLGLIVIFLVTFGIVSGLDLDRFRNTIKNKEIIIMCFVVMIIAVVATSGIISVSFSNDSMYYYYAYPHEIFRSGHFSNKFDTFLTDAGQGTAIINTLPFMFGFNESFGIQTFFNINFILFFFYSVYREARECCDSRKASVYATIFTLLLITSMPFVVISKWVLANVYFTELMFIIVVLNHDKKKNNTMFITMILTVALSFIRIEGSLFVGFIVLIYLLTKKVQKIEVIAMIVPTLLMQSMYFVRIFAFMHIYADDTFMSRNKAIIAVTFLTAVLIYGLIYSVDGYFEMLKEKLKFFSPEKVIFSGLILANVALLLYDYKLFVSNVVIFAVNLLQTGGWGLFPITLLLMIVLVPKENIKDNYFDYFWIGFLLLAFAACFARGDNLRADINDSGNRVMLQIVPFVIYAFAYRFIKAFYIQSHKEYQ